MAALGIFSQVGACEGQHDSKDVRMVFQQPGDLGTRGALSGVSGAECILRA